MMRLLSHDTFFAWTNLLSTLPIDCSNKTIEQNRRLISSISERSRVVRILQEILLDRKMLTDIAARSYRHINHFDKIVLIGNGDPCAYRLTLHLWQPPYTEREL